MAILKQSKLINYAIDILNDQVITGWICHKIFRKRPMQLHFYLDEKCIGQIVADEYRKDLINLQLHPTGKCGFSFVIEENIKLESYKRLTIRYGRWKSILISVDISEIPSVFREDIPKIFFMHIPKTAGTSFNNFVRLRYPSELISARLEAEATAHYPKLAREKSYLAGHLTLGEFKEHFDIDSYAVYTIVREPWLHLHSHLNWVRGIGKNPSSGFYFEHPPCVRELADRLNAPDAEISEVLERLVADMKGFEFDFFDNRQTRYFLDYRPEKVGDDDIAHALENFNYFVDIGRTEKYQDFVARFCRNYNIPFIQQTQRLNRSKHVSLYDAGDPELKSILYPLVRYDLKLYSAVTRQETVS